MTTQPAAKAFACTSAQQFSNIKKSGVLALHVRVSRIGKWRRDSRETIEGAFQEEIIGYAHSLPLAVGHPYSRRIATSGSVPQVRNVETRTDIAP
jgi:hypothetical protein